MTRRGRLTMAVLLAMGFASGWWAAQQVAASMARPDSTELVVAAASGDKQAAAPAPQAQAPQAASPPAAAAPVEPPAPSAAAQLARIAPSEPPSAGMPVPVPPEPPAVPDEILGRLPPTARGAAAPAVAGEHVVERVPAPAGAAEIQGPLEVEYTLDPRLNGRVAEILRRQQVELAHVIVLDPNDGRVLAYVSTDPTSFPATRAYPMASLMKVVTAAAVLQRDPDVTQRPCVFVGSPYHLTASLLNPPRYGHIATFEHALATSNNQCFAQLAVHELGASSVIDELHRLGVLESPAPGHPSGELDPVETPLDLGELGSGLAGTRIAPLTAARLAATLADGRIVAPRWIARVTDASGLALALPGALQPRPALDMQTTRSLRDMLVETTESGTASRGFHPGGRAMLGPIRVAGKTGSLNGTDPGGRYEWFIGVAPADDPRVAVAALVVNRGRWRRSASHLAAEVLQAVFCSDGVCRDEGRRSALRAGRASHSG
ncbi:MAG TPA: penicillin-binding transpeptidase domain-containing protein [Myxococcota bacterium]|nr:penicillin-binding transpeptidase domain-containing protein [Myxococcota bacterium]